MATIYRVDAADLVPVIWSRNADIEEVGSRILMAIKGQNEDLTKIAYYAVHKDELYIFTNPIPKGYHWMRASIANK